MEKRLLLVDDEEGIRKILGISLADRGYEVYTAKDGNEALKLYKEKKPPIILTDIKMPGMDGIELLKAIKKENPDAEVIMITGHGDMDLAIQSLKFDATDFITKPIEDEILEIALKRAEEKISLKRQVKEYTENLERLVEERTKQLIEAERLAAVGQTVATIAHAIKNITAGLTGGIFVLEKGIERNNKNYLRQGWEMVKKNVYRIKDLALDLLNYSKKREPSYKLCNPNDIIKDVFSLLLPEAREHGINFKLELDEELANVWLDPEEIHRCLLNLVTNAFDACTEIGTSGKSKEVVVRSRRAKDWAVEIEVQDNGIGMAKETLEMIFQRFFSTKGSKGTGMGLMITRKIIDEHGGTISVRSQPGAGTTFIIRLPGKDLKKDQPNRELLPGKDPHVSGVRQI